MQEAEDLLFATKPVNDVQAGRRLSIANDELTERELHVLKLITQGASNQDIADQFVITLGTVKAHTNHILSKLQARNRTEAVARARDVGWLER